MIKLIVEDEKKLNQIANSKWLKKFIVVPVYILDHIKNDMVYEFGLHTLMLNNFVSKSTAAERFIDLDNHCLKYFENDTIENIHDIGVSSGITSLQFYSLLKNHDYKSNFYISDKFSTLFYRGKYFCQVFDNNLDTLHYYFLRLYADRKLSYKNLLSKYLFYVLQKFSRKSKSGELVEVKLYHPFVLEALKSGHLRELIYDIFITKSTIKFNFIRIMNLLNNSYFSDKDIIKAVENVERSLNENGILLIGRTTKEGVNHASFFKKSSDKLKLIENYNEGSEIRNLL